MGFGPETGQQCRERRKEVALVATGQEQRTSGARGGEGESTGTLFSKYTKEDDATASPC